MIIVGIRLDIADSRESGSGPEGGVDYMAAADPLVTVIGFIETSYLEDWCTTHAVFSCEEPVDRVGIVVLEVSVTHLAYPGNGKAYPDSDSLCGDGLHITCHVDPLANWFHAHRCVEEQIYSPLSQAQSTGIGRSKK